MRISITILFFLTLLNMCISSCQNSAVDISRVQKSSQEKFITIDLQPFTDFSDKQQNYLVNQLRLVYPHVTLLKAIELPRSAFYAKRNRYRADSLIHFLSNHTPVGHVTIGLTTKDISTTKDTINDWGVMGLGFCPGAACIASSFRLTQNEKFLQLFKVSIHELGHTQGLAHCPVKYCFMRDAEGKNPTNEEKEFCITCKSFLNQKGWRFN